MRNRRRVYALILCVGMLLALSVSSAYIVQNAGHCCCVSQACRICQNVAQMVKLLTGCSLLAAMLWAVSVSLSVWRVSCQVRGRALPGLCTLVSWKIRLNN